MASGTSWLKGCAVGCGLMIVLAVVGTVGGGLMVMKPFKDAIESRERLDETFGEQQDYRPPVDGVPAPERIGIFLDVQEGLGSHCAGFTRTFERFREMDRLDGDQASGGEKFRLVMKTMKEAVGMPRRLGRLAIDRNGALAEAGMGLGEFTYIYALAYYAWLDIRPEDHVDGNVEMEDASPRVRSALREMLDHQLEDVRAAASDPALIAELEAEIDRLDDDRSLYPWQGAVPARVDAALAPYRGRFEASFCEATAPFILAVHREGAGKFSIQVD